MFNKKTKKGILIGVLAIFVATCSFGVISNKNSLDILRSKEVEASTVETNEDQIQSYVQSNESEKVEEKPSTVDNNLTDDETIISHEDSKGGVIKLLPMPGADSDKTQEIPLPVPDAKSKVTVIDLN